MKAKTVGSWIKITKFNLSGSIKEEIWHPLCNVNRMALVGDDFDFKGDYDIKTEIEIGNIIYCVEDTPEEIAL